MLSYKPSQQFQNKVRNFPSEVYRIGDPSTHIYKLMHAILEVGLGQLGLWQDEANSSESLPGTKFTDLDAMYAFLGITRLPDEIYTYDPYSDQLTADQWNEIFTKDSLFRLRIMKFFQALQRGGTLEGVQMMSEAASGVEVQVFEMWRVINGQGLAVGTTFGRRDGAGNLLLNLAKEFVIVPLEVISDDQRAAIVHLVDLVKPVNTVSTVHDTPSLPLTELPIRFSASEDHYFEVRRMVTSSNDPVFNTAGVWITPNQEVEAPTFALMDHSDTEFSLNEAVTSIKTFVVDEGFRISFGALSGNINSSTTTVTVEESSEPAAPSFSIKVGAEVMFVTDRVPVVNQNTRFTYTVLRAQEGSAGASHSDADPVYSGVVSIFSDDLSGGTGFGPWRSVPLADSPDNFPAGKLPGSPGKYDPSGSYLFDYGSQDEFLAWYRTQVHLLGGEVSGDQYRLPLNVESVGGLATTPADALAPPELLVQSRVFPGR